MEVVPGEMLGLLPHRRLFPEAIRGPVGLERATRELCLSTYLPSERDSELDHSGLCLLPWRYTNKFKKTIKTTDDGTCWVCASKSSLPEKKSLADASYMQSLLLILIHIAFSLA